MQRQHFQGAPLIRMAQDLELPFLYLEAMFPLYLYIYHAPARTTVNITLRGSPRRRTVWACLIL